jgi:hypothetical protein
MDTDLMQYGAIGLHRGELLRLRDAGGHFLGVVAGTVWITQENDTQDRVLSAGEHFRFDRGGLALVWPLDGSAKLMLEDGLVAERHLAPQVISVTRLAWLPERAFFERRARQMRAEAIGQATGQVLAAIAQCVKMLWGQFVRVYSATSQALLMARNLPALADSTLKDIGVHRDQIKRIANSSPRQVGMTL